MEPVKMIFTHGNKRVDFDFAGSEWDGLANFVTNVQKDRKAAATVSAPVAKPRQSKGSNTIYDALKSTIAAQLRQGIKANHIAEGLAIDMSGLYKWIKKNKAALATVAPKPKRKSRAGITLNTHKNAIARRLHAGEKAYNFASNYGVCATTLYTFIKRNNISKKG
jgi:hypothetical protein